MSRRPSSIATRSWVVVLLVAATTQAHGQAPGVTAPVIDWSQYFSNGAGMTSVAAAGQPGAAYFSNGAATTSVPAAGQPGGAYFSNGGEATGVPAPGQPGAAYFSNGGETTRVPAPGQPGATYFSNGGEATGVPARGQPGAAYFWNGAEATSVAASGALGAAYFSNGAEMMSMKIPTAPTPAAPPEEPPAAAQLPSPPASTPEPAVANAPAAPVEAAPPIAATTFVSDPGADALGSPSSPPLDPQAVTGGDDAASGQAAATDVTHEVAATVSQLTGLARLGAIARGMALVALLCTLALAVIAVYFAIVLASKRRVARNRVG